jgi:hypothetical protein
MYPATMSMLTQSQAEFLKWIVESGSGEVIHVGIGNAPKDIAIIPDGPRRDDLTPGDIRELVAQELLRHVSGQLHEVTNEDISCTKR